MAYSLLAHLYSHIRGSQEDVATYSLQYLISQSKNLNQCFTHLLSDVLNTDINCDLFYSCQSQGKNKERPDISGKHKAFKGMRRQRFGVYLSKCSNTSFMEST